MKHSSYFGVGASNCLFDLLALGASSGSVTFIFERPLISAICRGAVVGGGVFAEIYKNCFKLTLSSASAVLRASRTQAREGLIRAGLSDQHRAPLGI